MSSSRRFFEESAQMGSSFSSHKMFLHYFEVFEDPYCCSPLLSLLLKLGCFLTEHCGGGHRNFSGCICKFADFEFCAFGFKSSELGLNSTYVALFLLKVLGYLDVLPIVKKSGVFIYNFLDVRLSINVLALTFLLVTNVIYNINHIYVNTRCKKLLNENAGDTQYVNLD